MSNVFSEKKERSRGMALLIVVILFMLGSLVLTIGMGRAAFYDLRRARTLVESAQSYYVSESSAEDVVHRLRKGKTVSIGGIEVLSFAGAVATSSIAVGFNTVTIDTVGSLRSFFRSNRVKLSLGGGASFSFGLQSSTGGITLANSSEVVGNIYSNGAVTGAGSNLIYGDVVSAGPTGLISGVHATGSAYAHTIQAATVDKNAYYQSISGVIVGGTSFPGSPDQATSSLPITDAMIQDWEAIAAAGGVISGVASCPGGDYTIDSDMTIGPKKIECNLVIDKNSTNVTLTGPLWVTGTVTTKSGPAIKVDPGSPNESAIIIADNPIDRTVGSFMDLNSGTGFIGSSAGSYVLMISMNDSSSKGGSVTAITAGNRTTPGEREVIYYAPYGKISAANSVKLRGATAHKIELTQSASVEYQTGMISLLFTGGPGGGYIIDSWKEVE